MDKPNESNKIQEANKLLRCPVRLLTDDGRELLITAWSPSCKVEQPVTVTVEAFVMHRVEGKDDE